MATVSSAWRAATMLVAGLLCSPSPGWADSGWDTTGTWVHSELGTIRLLLTEQGGAITGVGVLATPPYQVLPSGPPFPELAGTRNGMNVHFLNDDWVQLSETSMSDLFGKTMTRITPAVCGNGAVEADEACDDGNLVTGDACTAICTAAACGNAVLEPDEECDDGNLTDGDGCSFDCRRCGNGTVDSGEACDDGNTTNGDGCTATCQLQVCGNGVVEAGEECDDANTGGGDGCDPHCLLEQCTVDGTWTTLDGNGILEVVLYETGGGTIAGGAHILHTNIATTLTGTRTGRQVSLHLAPSVPDVFGATIQGTLHCDGGLETLPGVIEYFRLRDAVCGNGTIEAGESCDDGNFLNGDACNVGCGPPICGNGATEAGEQCDPPSHPGDNRCCSATCQRSAIAKPLVTQSKLGSFHAPIKIKGTFLPQASFVPATMGLRVALAPAAPLAFVTSLTLPGGAYSPVTRVGWQTMRPGILWRYLNDQSAPSWIRRATVRRQTATGSYRVALVGSLYQGVTPDAGGLRLMVADAASAGICAETSFDDPGQSCTLRSHGSAATCR